MKVTETALPGVIVIAPQVHGDERGFFVETWQSARYREQVGITLTMVQHNHSRSRRGVLRGLHAQQRFPQGKLVRVCRGEIFDVAADINPDSPTFGQWVGATLSDSNHHQLWVPPGYAHGFVVLSDIADVEYKCTEYYYPDDEIGVIWNDPELAIDWPISDEPVVSARDAAWPTLQALKGMSQAQTSGSAPAQSRSQAPRTRS